jgi:hypothetical protein
VAIIPEQNHATSNCGCNELSLGNNLEGRVFTVICLPREFVKPATIPVSVTDPVFRGQICLTDTKMTDRTEKRWKILSFEVFRQISGQMTDRDQRPRLSTVETVSATQLS